MGGPPQFQYYEEDSLMGSGFIPLPFFLRERSADGERVLANGDLVGVSALRMIIFALSLLLFFLRERSADGERVLANGDLVGVPALRMIIFALSLLPFFLQRKKGREGIFCFIME
jgi:hypothetical protein